MLPILYYFPKYLCTVSSTWATWTVKMLHTTSFCPLACCSSVSLFGQCIPNCQKKSFAQTLLAAVSTQSPLPYHLLNLPFSINKFFLDLVVSIFYPHRINCQKQLCTVTHPPCPPQHPVLYQQLLAWIGSLSSGKPGSPAENLNGKLRHKKLPGSWIGNIIISIISF